MPGDRLGRADHAEKRAGDLQQAFAQGRVQGGSEQRIGQLALAMGLDRCRKQGLLVAEMAVHGEFGDAGLGRDLVHAHAFEPMHGEQLLGRFQDRGTLAQVFWTPRGGRGRLGVLVEGAVVGEDGAAHGLIVD